MRRLALLLLMTCTLSAPALAEEDTAALAERLERLERDVTFVQKQVYRSAGGSSGEHSTGGSINSGQAQVRFTQVDEEMRQIRGAVEQIQFQQRQLATDLKKISEDVDFRLRTLEQKQHASTEPPSTPTAGTISSEIPAPAEIAEAETAAEPSKPEVKEKPANYKPEAKEKPAASGADFPNANAHYSHAFKLLNEKKFADAAASFDAFVKKYPTDPLTSNAYYWLGESQYVRKDFTRSAESFRKGFETNPEGQKAPDNLYKLAMSLGQVKRTSEACIVLKRVIDKYSESAARTAVKAQDARGTLQCK